MTREPETLRSWTAPESHPRSGVALVILLDQLSRNIHRGTSQAFAFDEEARSASHRVFANVKYNELRPVEVAHTH